MRASAARARRWSLTTVGLAADVHLFLVLALVLWLLLPTVAFGWSSVLVSSGSMSPAIRAGDIVLLDRPPELPLGTGTVVTYRDGDGFEARLVTHRVRQVGDDGAYITRGDANVTDDLHPVPPERVEGYGRLLIPMLGLPVHWARTDRYLELTLFILATLGAAVVSAMTAPQVAAATEPVRRQVRRAVQAATGSAPSQAAPSEPVTAAAGDELLFAHLTTGGTTTSLWETVPVLATVPAAQATSIMVDEVTEAQHPSGTGDEPDGSEFLGEVIGDPSAGARRLRRWSVLGLVFGLLVAGGLRLPVAEAALTASTASVGNSFSTAADPGEGEPGLPAEVVLPALDGNPSFVGGQQSTILAFEVPVTATTTLQGTATAQLLVRPSTPGNPARTIGVTLQTSDGSVLAAASVQEQGWANGDTLVTLLLTPELNTTLPAGEVLTVLVEVRRLELALDGPSVVLLPVVE